MKESGNMSINENNSILKEYVEKIGGHYRNARLLWIISAVFLVFAVIYTVTSYLSIQKKVNEFNSLYEAETPMPGNELPGVFRLRKESAFWQSRLAMAKSDSICVAIDLVDSVVCLELQGVVVHSARILHFVKSDLFESLKPEAVLNLIAQPTTVAKTESSLSKEPLKLKKAPENSEMAAEEAAREAKEPGEDVSELDFYYNLYLSNGMQVSFSEDQVEGNWRAIPHYLKKKIEKIEKNSLQLTRLKLPEYTPGILIELSREDMMSVYRGMPANAMVVVRL